MAIQEAERQSGLQQAASGRGPASTGDGQCRSDRRTTDPVWAGAGADRRLSRRRLAQGLGWFSIGLGLAELAAPRQLSRMIGAPTARPQLVRAMGVREIASGVAILGGLVAPGTAVWSRVLGDAVDLASLGAAMASPRSDRGRLLAAGAAVAGATILDVLCARQYSPGAERRKGPLPVTVSLVIDRSPEELYRHWHDFANLPTFMTYLEYVKVLDDRRSHWVAKGPAGSHIEWDAEITEDRPSEYIAWRTAGDSDVEHSGSVRFAPAAGNRGTLVTVELRYRPVGGSVGAAIASLFGKEPSQTIKMDLRRFKQVMETGEVITTEGQPAGRAESTSWRYDSAVRT